MHYVLAAVQFTLLATVGHSSPLPHCRVGLPVAHARLASPVCMAKGDGKQRRPKQPPPSTPPSPPESESETRRRNRVSQDSLLSVRKQIAIVKAYNKQRNAAPAKPAARTSFRKKPSESANRTRAAVEVEVDVDLSVQTLMFIDGYNVIGAWPRLKKRWQNGDLDAAREMLLADVAEFAIRRVEAVVVFDAAGAADRIEGKDRYAEYAAGLVQVVYAHDSADAYIERETKRMRAEQRAVQVATSDSGIATACSVYGATVMSSLRFVQELKASRKASAALVDDFNARQQRSAPRTTLWDVFDVDMQQKLSKQIEKSSLSALSRRDREAMEASERAKSAGELERGAAATRRRLLAEQQQRQRAPKSNGIDISVDRRVDES